VIADCRADPVEHQDPLGPPRRADPVSYHDERAWTLSERFFGNSLGHRVEMTGRLVQDDDRRR
jgi:hypothetical protein